jgi:hypothetical protein
MSKPNDGRNAMRCKFEVVKIERAYVVIRDIGGTDCMTVTNDAEAAVAELRKSELLPPGRRLFYYDSLGDLDEIIVNDRGFVGFKVLPVGFDPSTVQAMEVGP